MEWPLTSSHYVGAAGIPHYILFSAACRPRTLDRPLLAYALRTWDTHPYALRRKLETRLETKLELGILYPLSFQTSSTNLELRNTIGFHTLFRVSAPLRVILRGKRVSDGWLLAYRVCGWLVVCWFTRQSSCVKLRHTVSTDVAILFLIDYVIVSPASSRFSLHM